MAPTTSHPRGVARRDFLHGRWTNEAPLPPSSFEIASILVQARPDRLDEAIAAIEAMPGAQIYTRDARGKLVVVLETSGPDCIGATLNTISLLPGVITASLVFHATDDA